MNIIGANFQLRGKTPFFLPFTITTNMSSTSDSEYERKKAELEATHKAKKAEHRRKQEMEKKAEEDRRAVEIQAAAEKRRVEVAIRVEKQGKKKDDGAPNKGKRKGRVIISEPDSESEVDGLDSDKGESGKKCVVCIKWGVACRWYTVSIGMPGPHLRVNSGLDRQIEKLHLLSGDEDPMPYRQAGNGSFEPE